jgi:CRP-like cAMP-binding protein
LYSVNKNDDSIINMKAQLDNINGFIASLDAETLAALDGISVQRAYKKGEFLLKQDDVCRKSYWIETGMARKYYLHDGKEITTELYFEQDIAVSFDSY